MRLLLDTNCLLWAAIRPERLPERVRSILLDESNEICVSAASAWEIATKVRIGKLSEAVLFEQNYSEDTKRAGYVHLPITPEIALRSARLPGVHRDPFDRIIAAHALAEDIPVISADPKLDAFGVRRLW